MTTKQYIAKIDKSVKELTSGKFIYDCVSTVHGEQVDRIFLLGEASDGRKIGRYSEKETGIYVNPLTQSPKKFPVRGKTGKTKFASGKKAGQPHRTRWFKNYKAFRQQIGRQVSYVNLQLTTNLSSDYANSLRVKGNTVQSLVKGKKNVAKFEGSIKRYGKRVWKLSKAEKLRLRNCVLNKMKGKL